MHLWGGQPPSCLSSLPRLWRRGWWQLFIPQIMATHGKPDLLVIKAIRKIPVFCLLWHVEVGPLNACFASTVLLHPIGHIMAPIPGVLHRKGNCSLQFLPCPGEGCGQLITGPRMDREDTFSLWPTLCVSIGWWCHGQCFDQTPGRGLMVGRSPGRIHVDIAGFDLMSVRMGQVLGATVICGAGMGCVLQQRHFMWFYSDSTLRVSVVSVLCVETLFFPLQLWKQESNTTNQISQFKISLIQDTILKKPPYSYFRLFLLGKERWRFYCGFSAFMYEELK